MKGEFGVCTRHETVIQGTSEILWIQSPSGAGSKVVAAFTGSTNKNRKALDKIENLPFHSLNAYANLLFCRKLAMVDVAKKSEEDLVTLLNSYM